MKEYIMVKSVGIIAIVIMICMVAKDKTAEGKEELRCDVVNSCIFPCRKFLESGIYLPGECCDGFQYLMNNEANTKTDRRTACYCLQKLMISERVIKRLAVIPSACQIKTPFVVSPDTDCSQ